ncbi:Tox-REase-5 domain-containing protein, partial [Paracoccus sp. (in: a-proteobacteria)]|uniref:Tox-REase-5 domain-containing protein n=1 Tax=Paracoccus sp. TaxID=267 RepID=UPI003A89A700
VFGEVPPAARRGYDYQHFVCPWHYYVPEANIIGEWSFMGVNFDGLHPVECHLFEAKHGYDGFLQQDDWSAEGRPELRDWVERSGSTIFIDMKEQAYKQAMVVLPLYPDVRLTWVFSSMMTKLYVFQIFLDRRLVPPIDAEVRPFVERDYHE